MSLSAVVRVTSVGFLLTVVFAGIGPASSRAATIFTSFGPSDSFDDTQALAVQGTSLTPPFKYIDAGSLFTASEGGAVTGVDLALEGAAGTASVFLSFWTDVGGLPGTQIGGVFSVALPSSPGVVAVTGITGIDLVGGQNYVLELAPGGSNTVADWYVNNQGLLGAIGNNSTGWKSDGADAREGAFDVTGGTAAIPEPVSAALLVPGLAAMALIRRRARRAAWP